MAWIFALLVVLNGVYWAYETYFDAPPAPVDFWSFSALITTRSPAGASMRAL